MFRREAPETVWAAFADTMTLAAVVFLVTLIAVLAAYSRTERSGGGDRGHACPPPPPPCPTCPECQQCPATLRGEVGGKVIGEISDGLLFEPGKADFIESPRAIQEIRRVADRIDEELQRSRAPNLRILIEGHTDSRPIHNQQFQSNWELSSSRATTVLHKIVGYLAAKGGGDSGVVARRTCIYHGQLAAIGLADTMPKNLLSPTAPENRRVQVRMGIVIGEAPTNSLQERCQKVADEAR